MTRFVIVKLALLLGGLTVEDVGELPEDVFEMRLEAGGLQLSLHPI